MEKLSVLSLTRRAARDLGYKIELEDRDIEKLPVFLFEGSVLNSIVHEKERVAAKVLIVPKNHDLKIAELEYGELESNDDYDVYFSFTKENIELDYSSDEHKIWSHRLKEIWPMLYKFVSTSSLDNFRQSTTNSKSTRSKKFRPGQSIKKLYRAKGARRFMDELSFGKVGSVIDDKFFDELCKVVIDTSKLDMLLHYVAKLKSRPGVDVKELAKEKKKKDIIDYVAREVFSFIISLGALISVSAVVLWGFSVISPIVLISAVGASVFSFYLAGGLAVLFRGLVKKRIKNSFLDKVEGLAEVVEKLKNLQNTLDEDGYHLDLRDIPVLGKQSRRFIIRWFENKTNGRFFSADNLRVYADYSLRKKILKIVSKNQDVVAKPLSEGVVKPVLGLDSEVPAVPAVSETIPSSVQAPVSTLKVEEASQVISAPVSEMDSAPKDQELLEAPIAAISESDSIKVQDVSEITPSPAPVSETEAVTKVGANLVQDLATRIAKTIAPEVKKKYPAPKI